MGRRTQASYLKDGITTLGCGRQSQRLKELYNKMTVKLWRDNGDSLVSEITVIDRSDFDLRNYDCQIDAFEALKKRFKGYFAFKILNVNGYIFRHYNDTWVLIE